MIDGARCAGSVKVAVRSCLPLKSILRYRGRDAGHPTPPAQIRTCGYCIRLQPRMNSGTHDVPHTAKPLRHEEPALSRDGGEFERCPPRSAAFPPPPPPSTGPLCSAGSQVLRRGQTSPGRTGPSCGLGLHGPVWIVRPRHAGDLPVLVHVVTQRARRVAFPLSGESRHPCTGLRLPRTDRPFAI